ncbi:MAG: ABC transporter substrate-binding protein [Alphaproteobacteria bacterium]|nr:ABC transporter substrate-binding protein [Alphaproteobacteria bacterium]
MIRQKLAAISLSAIVILSLSSQNLFSSPLAEDKTFRWAASGDANSLEPYGAFEVPTLSFLDNIYETLVRRNKKMTLEPALATKWEQTAPDIWRFELRQALFHDGTPFNADDVIFSLNRAKAQGSGIANKLVSIKEARKIDDRTIEFVTDGINPILPAEIAQWYIMSEKWCKANNTEKPTNFTKSEDNFAGRNANGTGPFKVVSREQDVETVLEYNDKWWDKGDCNFKRAIFTPIKSAQTRVAALLTNKADVIFPVPPPDVERIKKSKDHVVLQGPEYRTMIIGMNQWADELPESGIKGKNPFKDKNVRLALYHAIDIDAMYQKVMRGASVPTGLIFAPDTQGFNADLNNRLPYDLEKAKKLMEEAGYKDGFKVIFDVPTDRYVADEEIGKAVTAMLAKINIKVELNAQPKSKFIPKILSRDTSMYLFGWTPMSLDAYDPLSTLVQTVEGNIKGLYNLGKYSNPTLDALIDKIRIEIDQNVRNKMIYDACKIVKDDVAVIPLHQQKLDWGHHKNIELTQTGDDYFRLRWVSIK